MFGRYNAYEVTWLEGINIREPCRKDNVTEQLEQTRVVAMFNLLLDSIESQVNLYQRAIDQHFLAYTKPEKSLNQVSKCSLLEHMNGVVRETRWLGYFSVPAVVGCNKPFLDILNIVTSAPNF